MADYRSSQSQPDLYASISKAPPPSDLLVVNTIVQEGSVAARVRAVQQSQQVENDLLDFKRDRRLVPSRLRSDAASFLQGRAEASAPKIRLVSDSDIQSTFRQPSGATKIRKHAPRIAPYQSNTRSRTESDGETGLVSLSPSLRHEKEPKNDSSISKAPRSRPANDLILNPVEDLENTIMIGGNFWEATTDASELGGGDHAAILAPSTKRNSFENISAKLRAFEQNSISSDQHESQNGQTTTLMDQLRQKIDERFLVQALSARKIAEIYDRSYGSTQSIDRNSSTVIPRAVPQRSNIGSDSRPRNPSMPKPLEYTAPAAATTYLDPTALRSQGEFQEYGDRRNKSHTRDYIQNKVPRKYQLPTNHYHNNKKWIEQYTHSTNSHTSLDPNANPSQFTEFLPPTDNQEWCCKIGKPSSLVKDEALQSPNADRYISGHLPRSDETPHREVSSRISRYPSPVVKIPGPPSPIYMSPISTGKKWSWRKHMSGKDSSLGNGSRIPDQQVDYDRVSFQTPKPYTLDQDLECSYKGRMTESWPGQGLDSVIAIEKLRSISDASVRRSRSGSSDSSPCQNATDSLDDGDTNRKIRIFASRKIVHIHISKWPPEDDPSTKEICAGMGSEEPRSNRKIIVTIEEGSNEAVRIEIRSPNRRQGAAEDV